MQRSRFFGSIVLSATLLAAACSSGPPASAGASSAAATHNVGVGAPSSAAQVRADFDGDGYADLAVGSPRETIAGAQGEEHGTVSVLYGSKAGVTTRDQLWHRNRPGVKGVASGMMAGNPLDCCAGRFGEVIAVGDFNGDRYDDLVASAAENQALPGVPAQPASVNVLYGSPRGLTATGDQLWSLASRGVSGSPRVSDFEQFVVGDFNGDRRDDLVFRSQGRHSTGGRIHMLLGSPRGLTASGAVVLTRSSPGVAGDGFFGQSMTVGNFNGDRADDLAVNASKPRRRGGTVSVFTGGPRGISPSRDEVWSADSPGVPGTRRELGNFGFVLASGDFNGDKRDELAVSVGGTFGSSEAGVLILNGTPSGLTASGPTPVLRHNSAGLPATAGDRHEFGARLAAGDVTADGRDELAIMSEYTYLPGEKLCDDVEDLPYMGAGVVYLLKGSSTGITTARSQVLGSNLRFTNHNFTADMCVSEVGKHIAFDDHNGDGFAELDLSFGIWNFPSTEADAMGIAVLPGTAEGASLTGQLWGAHTTGVASSCCFSTLAQRQLPEHNI